MEILKKKVAKNDLNTHLAKWSQLLYVVNIHFIPRALRKELSVRMTFDPVRSK